MWNTNYKLFSELACWLTHVSGICIGLLLHTYTVLLAILIPGRLLNLYLTQRVKSLPHTSVRKITPLFRLRSGILFCIRRTAAETSGFRNSKQSFPNVSTLRSLFTIYLYAFKFLYAQKQRKLQECCKFLLVFLFLGAQSFRPSHIQAQRDDDS